ncbi:MAG: HAMP domain-containing histidine kinase [Clostridia bacterium]|nr:HAMP domain-containing histidine kinase [Clostridia bacterium]NCC44227.1 HAMP domain-containing histidine kinase [Clostridia bacterium]
MESGSKVKNLIKLVVPIAVMVLLVNLFLDVVFYRQYQEKLDIFSVAVQTGDENSLDMIINMLRGSKEDPNAAEIKKDDRDIGKTETLTGREILESYGYLEYNVYLKKFYRECFVTAIVSLILTLFLFGVIYRERKRQKEETDEILDQIEESLLEFRKNNLHNHPIKGESEGIQRVNHQMEALGDYIRVMKNQAMAEKEETKELVTDISHQLKTPVAALDTCFSILLEQELNDTERKEFEQRCRNALDGLEQLLQSLLQISKLETGMIQIELKMAKLLDTIVSALNRVYPQAVLKNVDISSEYEEAVGKIYVMQDAKWLSEALINILENAVKYSPSGSEITIRLLRRTTFVRVEISDQGIGIPKEEYHKIFQRFYRGSSSKVAKESGSGVGLYLAREIIEQHHGSLSVHSGKEKSNSEYPGSTFVVHIPIS